MDEVDEFLAHYGVKGMKWGVRKRSGDSSGSSEKRLSRKDFKAKVSSEKAAFYENKASRILDEASKDPKTLISIKTAGTYPTVVTGKEFVSYLSSGGSFDIRATDVYARRTAEGPYALNTSMNQQYKKPKR